MITIENTMLLTVFALTFITPIYLDWQMRKKNK